MTIGGTMLFSTLFMPEEKTSLAAGLWLQCKTAAAAIQHGSYTNFGIENIYLLVVNLGKLLCLSKPQFPAFSH